MPYVERCPIGCGERLESSSIVVAEDPLLKCCKCGQLIRQCTEDSYTRSVEGFNIPKGTSPIGKTILRSYKCYLKQLKKIERLCGLPPHKTRLLDVGCSSGSFLGFAKTLGYAVTGVEPAFKAAETAIRQGLNVKQVFLKT